MTGQQVYDVYTALYFKSQEMQEERYELETSLKAEIINNEEQRAYIEVLKSAIELKLDELGITCKDIESFTNYAGLKQETENYRKDSVRLASIVADQEAQISRLNGQIRKLTNDMDHVSRTKADIQMEMSKESEAVVAAKANLQKIDEEKAALIDYLEEQTSQLKVKSEEVTIAFAKQETVQRQVDQLTQMNESLKQDAFNLENEIKKLRFEGEEKDRTIEAEKQTLEDLFNEIRLKDEEAENLQSQMLRDKGVADKEKAKLNHDISMLTAEIKKNKEEISEKITQLTSVKVKASEDFAVIDNLNLQVMNSRNKTETLQANFSAISNTLKETQNEKDVLQASHDKQMREKTELQQVHDHTKGRLDESENNRSSLQEQIATIQQKMQDSHFTFESVIDQLKGDVSKHSEIAKSTAQKHEDEINEKANIQTQLHEKEMHLVDVGKERDQLEQELKFTHESFTNREMVMNGQIHELETTVNDMEMQINGLNNDLQGLRIENEGLGTKLLTTQRQHEDTLHNLKLAETDLKSAHAEINRHESNISSLTHNCKMVEGDLHQQQLRNEDLVNELSVKASELGNSDKSNQMMSSENEILNSRLKNLTTENNSLSAAHTEASQKVTKQKIKKANNRARLGSSSNQLSQLQAAVDETMGHINLSNPAIGSPMKILVGKYVTSIPSGSTNPIAGLTNYVKGSLKEIDGLQKANNSLRDQLSDVRNDLARSHDSSHREITELKDHYENQISHLTFQREDQSRGHDESVEHMRREHETLVNENSSLALDHNAVLEELQNLRIRFNAIMEESVKWKQDSENEVAQTRHFEEQISLLELEKKGLEGLLARATMNIPIISIQRIFSDIVKCRNEIEISERERLTITHQLSLGEAQRTISSIDLIKEQISSCDSHINMHKRRLANLEGELQNAEMSERRRAMSGSRLED